MILYDIILYDNRQKSWINSVPVNFSRKIEFALQKSFVEISEESIMNCFHPEKQLNIIN